MTIKTEVKAGLGGSYYNHNETPERSRVATGTGMTVKTGLKAGVGCTRCPFRRSGGRAGDDRTDNASVVCRRGHLEAGAG